MSKEIVCVEVRCCFCGVHMYVPKYMENKDNVCGSCGRKAQ